RRALSRRPPAPRRRPLAEALARLSGARRRDSAGVQGREARPLHPDGTEVLGMDPEEPRRVPPLGRVLEDVVLEGHGGVVELGEGPPREPGARREGGPEVTGKVSLTIRIRRYNPEVRPEPWWDEHVVGAEPSDRLLDALHYVKWYRDGSLALRRSCAHGVCGSDAMLINGKNRLACKILVKQVAPRVTIEPIRGLPVLKDLIVDMEPFFAGYKRMLPFLINDEETTDRERIQSPEERAAFDDTTKCILCAACP